MSRNRGLEAGKGSWRRGAAGANHGAAYLPVGTTIDKEHYDNHYECLIKDIKARREVCERELRLRSESWGRRRRQAGPKQPLEDCETSKTEVL